MNFHIFFHVNFIVYSVDLLCKYHAKGLIHSLKVRSELPYWLLIENEKKNPTYTHLFGTIRLLIFSKKSHLYVYSVLYFYYFFKKIPTYTFIQTRRLFGTLEYVLQFFSLISDGLGGVLKFIYSEKATKFCKISTVDLTVTI